ncbi:hypothetical protein TNCV_3349381 [Trichonephila clavipes]|nr:hypothetical protein TNCV_3349381 [Trichonephila clavipes]
MLNFLNPNSKNLVGSVNPGGGYVLVWESKSASGLGNLEFFKNTFSDGAHGDGDRDGHDDGDHGGGDHDGHDGGDHGGHDGGDHGGHDDDALLQYQVFQKHIEEQQSKKQLIGLQ